MRKTKKSNSLNWITPGFILVGSGLLFLGVTSAIWLAGMGQTIESTKAVSVVPAPVNFPAPQLELIDLQGASISLEQFRGQVVLINNWATWCPPCKAEMPTLQAYYERYENQDFVLIAINAGDSVLDVEEFTRAFGLTFPVWIDSKIKTLSAFRNDALPSSYVVDREGIVRLAWTGAVSIDTLEKYVSPLLEE